MKHLIDAGDRNLEEFGDLIQFLIVEGDWNTVRFIRNAYEGCGPRTRGVLDEVGGKVRV